MTWGEIWMISGIALGVIAISAVLMRWNDR